MEAETLLVFSQQFFGIFLTLFSSSPAGSYPALHHPWETVHFKVIFPFLVGLFFNPPHPHLSASLFWGIPAGSGPGTSVGRSVWEKLPQMLGFPLILAFFSPHLIFFSPLL